MRPPVWSIAAWLRERFTSGGDEAARRKKPVAPLGLERLRFNEGVPYLVVPPRRIARVHYICP